VKLTGIILTYNEAAHILDCIDSLRFADDILVFDSGSPDSTVALAQQAGARVIQHPFKDYASQRNAALGAVRDATDWVLFVDADERVTPELASEVREAIQNPNHVGYNIPRHNYIFGKLTRGAGWYPDFQLRLLKVGCAQYDPTREVHEVVILKGSQGTLRNHFVHYNYRDFAQFTQKQRKYSDYDAQILFKQGNRPKPQNYLLQPLRQFRWRYLTLKGYKDGLHGLWLSLLMAWYELRKYRVLRQLWRAETRKQG
jgi:glycosyltransferase involved in cell wall biosynthesis